MKTIPTTAVSSNKDQVSPGGQARISCPPQIVTGLDKLEVSLWLSFEDYDIFERLSQLKKDAQEMDVQFLPITFGDKDFFNWNLQRTGTKQYSFVLRSGDITVQLSTRDHKSNFPNCRVEVGSVSCQEYSIRIYERLLKWFQFYGLRKEKELVSRVDLAIDCIDTDIESLGVSLRNRWICRARKFSIFYEGLSLTGIMLGKGDLCLRVYDKTRELIHNKTKRQFFLELWKCDEEIPVTRVEFQFRRPVLKDMKIPVNTVSDFEKNCDSLWQFAIKWARLARRSIDQKNNNQKHAKLSVTWLQLQGAVFSFPAMANFREKKTFTKNLVALRDQARGCILNLAAATGHDVDDYFGILKTCTDAISEDLASFMSNRYNDFVKLFQVRQNQCYVGFSYSPPEFNSQKADQIARKWAPFRMSQKELYC